MKSTTLHMKVLEIQNYSFTNISQVHEIRDILPREQQSIYITRDRSRNSVSDGSRSKMQRAGGAPASDMVLVFKNMIFYIASYIFLNWTVSGLANTTT